MSTVSFLDGNAAAGDLRELFSVDLSNAVGQCTHCEKIAHIGQAHLYAFSPGVVLRCSACEHPLLRLVKGAGLAWVDVRGLKYLQVEMPAP